MFYYLSGELTYRDLNYCVIDCGGVGYKLTISHITSESLGGRLGKLAKLFTYMAVREDGIELFGFSSEEEKFWFEKLISVSGVGPKAAISILSILTPNALAVAICTDDKKSISKAQGVGAKTAARVVLELKDKTSLDTSFGDTDIPAATVASAQNNQNFKEAVEALSTLGYDKSTILNVLKNIDTANTDVGEIIRLALKKLAQ